MIFEGEQASRVFFCRIRCYVASLLLLFQLVFDASHAQGTVHEPGPAAQEEENAPRVLTHRHLTFAAFFSVNIAPLLTQAGKITRGRTSDQHHPDLRQEY
jgi:hypothetical protein